jgi:uncharacterized protein YrrD
MPHGLRRTSELNGFDLYAQEEKAGTVKDVLFGEEEWAIRYFVIDTGTWLSDRKVVIPRQMLAAIDYDSRRIACRLTKKRIEDSPPIGPREPVSRRHETFLLRAMSLHPYWSSEVGGALHPIGRRASQSPVGDLDASTERAPEETTVSAADPILRSCDEVEGYFVDAEGGEIGHIADFLFDEDQWRIRYIVIDTRNVLPSKEVLLETRWIKRIDWTEARVKVDVARDAIEAAPRYDRDEPLTPEKEETLHEHYR